MRFLLLSLLFYLNGWIEYVFCNEDRYIFEQIPHTPSRPLLDNATMRSNWNVLNQVYEKLRHEVYDDQIGEFYDLFALLNQPVFNSAYLLAGGSEDVLGEQTVLHSKEDCLKALYVYGLIMDIVNGLGCLTWRDPLRNDDLWVQGQRFFVWEQLPYIVCEAQGILTGEPKEQLLLSLESIQKALTDFRKVDKENRQPNFSGSLNIKPREEVIDFVKKGLRM